MTIFGTERLILRNWRAADRQPFTQMNADPLVMEFMPATLSNSESGMLVDKIEKHFLTHGFGLFAAELTCKPFLHWLHRSGHPVIMKPDSRPMWRWVGDCRQFTGARDWQPKVHARCGGTLSEFSSLMMSSHLQSLLMPGLAVYRDFVERNPVRERPRGRVCAR